MKQLVLIPVFLFTFYATYAQNMYIPKWCNAAFNNKKLNKIYEIKQYIKPGFLKADYNSDNVEDIAILVTNKNNKKKGIIIIHNKTFEVFVLGAGKNFGNGGDNFTWMKNWANYNKPIANETLFNTESGDIIGSRKIKLKRNALEVSDLESAGGIIYWNGKKYIWIHQGD